MSTKLNAFAPEYTPIQPGITTTNQNNPPPPFSAVLHHIIPPTQPTTHYSSQFHAYVSYTSVQPTYHVHTHNSPRRVGPREVVNGRSGSRQRGRKEVFGRNEKKWGHVCHERKVLGFEKEEEKNGHDVLPLKWEEEKTSVMIKNIPYDCPRKELMKFLDGFCMKQNENNNDEVVAYDFLYLPIDFRTTKSRGFAFVNFTNAKSVRKFFNAWNLAAWDSVHWRRWTKTIEIVTAQIQGKEALVRHFSGSFFECESDEFLPVTFNPARNGSGQPIEMTVVGNRRAFQRWRARKA